jgi:hypothetical protein
MILIRLSETADDYPLQRGRRGMVDTLTHPSGSVQNSEVGRDGNKLRLEMTFGLQRKYPGWEVETTGSERKRQIDE